MMETINKIKNFFVCDKVHNVYYSETDKKKKIDNVSRKNNDNSNNLTNDFEEKIMIQIYIILVDLIKNIQMKNY